MAAESANELGRTGEAGNYLEMVRARARGTNASLLPKVTTADQAVMREAIRHERRVELGWNLTASMIWYAGALHVKYCMQQETGYQDKHALLPLPQTEVDKSNGVLIQNPNY